MDHLCRLRIYAKTDQVRYIIIWTDITRWDVCGTGEQFIDEETGTGDSSV